MQGFLHLRAEIDGIDKSVIDLFHQRFNVVKSVKRFKNMQPNGHIFIDPVREWDMWQDWSSKIPPNSYSSASYFQILRCFISSSNIMEQPGLQVQVLGNVVPEIPAFYCNLVPCQSVEPQNFRLDNATIIAFENVSSVASMLIEDEFAIFHKIGNHFLAARTPIVQNSNATYVNSNGDIVPFGSQNIIGYYFTYNI